MDGEVYTGHDCRRICGFAWALMDPLMKEVLGNYLHTVLTTYNQLL